MLDILLMTIVKLYGLMDKIDACFFKTLSRINFQEIENNN